MRLKPPGKAWKAFTECTVSPWLPTSSLSRLRFTTEVEPRAGSVGSHLRPSREFKLWCRPSEAQPQAQQRAQANETSEPALHSCQQGSCTWLATHGQTLWDVQHNAQVRSNGDKSAEICCSEKPQQLHGVKISAAGPARNSIRSYLGICIALPISSTLSSNSSPYSADYACLKKKGRFKYWCSKLLC